MTELRVLDLFCGLKGWSAPFEREHRVVSLDLDPAFEPTIAADILEVSSADILAAFGGRRPDIILASPPCETFSVASIGHHWAGGYRAYVPKTEEAVIGKRLVQKAVYLIQELRPVFAVIENPRGVLRKLGLIPAQPTTVWYCHYGESRAKPTDLWGLPFPPSWKPEPPCHSNRGHRPECCCHDHEAARRGAKTGTQGIQTYAERSVIPYALADSIARACEEDLGFARSR